MEQIGQKDYLLQRFTEAGDYDFLPGGLLPRILDALIAADEGYMQDAGIGRRAL